MSEPVPPGGTDPKIVSITALREKAQRDKQQTENTGLDDERCAVLLDILKSSGTAPEFAAEACRYLRRHLEKPQIRAERTSILKSILRHAQDPEMAIWATGQLLDHAGQKGVAIDRRLDLYAAVKQHMYKTDDANRLNALVYQHVDALVETTKMPVLKASILADRMKQGPIDLLATVLIDRFRAGLKGDDLRNGTQLLLACKNCSHLSSHKSADISQRLADYLGMAASPRAEKKAGEKKQETPSLDEVKSWSALTGAPSAGDDEETISWKDLVAEGSADEAKDAEPSITWAALIETPPVEKIMTDNFDKGFVIDFNPAYVMGYKLARQTMDLSPFSKCPSPAPDGDGEDRPFAPNSPVQ